MIILIVTSAKVIISQNIRKFEYGCIMNFGAFQNSLFALESHLVDKKCNLEFPCSKNISCSSSALFSDAYITFAIFLFTFILRMAFNYFQSLWLAVTDVDDTKCWRQIWSFLRISPKSKFRHQSSKIVTKNSNNVEKYKKPTSLTPWTLVTLVSFVSHRHRVVVLKKYSLLWIIIYDDYVKIMKDFYLPIFGDKWFFAGSNDSTADFKLPVLDFLVSTWNITTRRPTVRWATDIRTVRTCGTDGTSIPAQFQCGNFP